MNKHVQKHKFIKKLSCQRYKVHKFRKRISLITNNREMGTIYSTEYIRIQVENSKLKFDLPESRGADQNSPIVSVHSGLGRRRSKCHGLADGARTQKQKRRHRHCRHGVEESAHLAAHAGNGILMNFGLKRKKRINLCLELVCNQRPKSVNCKKASPSE